MKILSKEIKTNGTTYKQIKRDSYRAMYLSNEGYYEVFRVDVKPDMEVFGKLIPEHEHYPTTNEFGMITWCTRDKERAEEIYEGIEPKQEKDG